MKLIKFILVLLCCTILISPLIILILDAVNEKEKSFLFKMYYEL